MAEERPIAGEGDLAPANGRESVEAVMRRLELAVARVAKLSEGLPTAGDLFSPEVQLHQAELLSDNYADLKTQYLRLLADHQALQAAYGALKARQGEAEHRLGKAIDRARELLGEKTVNGGG